MKKENRGAAINGTRPDEQTAEAFGVWFDSSTDAIFIYTLTDDDKPRPFLVANQAAQQKLGYDLRQFRHMTLLDILTPEERVVQGPLLQDRFKQSLSSFETQVVDADGKVTWASVRTSTFHGQQIRNVISVVSDITDLKTAEEALLQKTSELEAVFQALPDLYFRVDCEGTILDWRAGRASDLYVPPADFMGKRIREFLPGPVAEQFAEALSEVASGKPMAIVEYSLDMQDSTQHFLGRVLPFMEDQAVMVVQNITELRQAEENLAEQGARFRLMMENAQDVIFRMRLKPEPYFEYVSPSAISITGYTPEEHYGDPQLALKLIHPDDLPLLQSLAVDGSNPPKPLTMRWIHKDGHTVWTEVLNVPVFDATGELVALDGIGRDITERVLAEEALKAERSFTETTLNSLKEIFYALDRQGNPVRWNKALSEITGYSDDEIAKMGVADFFAPAYRGEVETITEETFAGRQTTVEGMLISKDGRHLPFEFTGSPLLDAQGEVIGLCGVGRDVSDRRAAANALRRQKKFSDELLDNMGVGFVANNSARKKVFINKAFERMTGYSREELVGEAPPFSYWAEENIDTIQDAFARAHRGEPGPWDLVFKRKNGERFNALVTTAEMQTDEGETIVTATFEDITDRKRAEETLRLSETRYKAVVDDQTDLVTRFKPDGTVTFCNEACGRFAGLPVEALIGVDYYRFLPPEEAEKARAAIDALSVDNPSGSAEFQVNRGDGQVIWMLWTAQAIFDDQGKPVEIQSVGRDITASKLMQDRLELLNSCFLSLGPDPHENISKIMEAGLMILGGSFMQYCRPEKGLTLTCSALHPFNGFVKTENTACNLWKRVSESGTNPLVIESLDENESDTCDPVFSEKQVKSFMGTSIKLAGDTIGCLGLTDTRDRVFNQEEREIFMMVSKAVAIEEERWAYEENLRDFIDIASHELRHPITIMKGYAIALDTLDEQLDKETKKNALQAIDQASDRLNRLVSELLNISRIEKGRFSIMKEDAPIEPLIKQAVGEMHARVGANRFELRLEPDMGTRRLDPEKLVQLLVLLLDNAVKFSPPESPIEIEARIYDGDLMISVKDRGPGVPVTETRKVFDRFFQLEDAMHHSSQGIGLGLYIAKKIVEAHGGEIWCERRDGGGSVFSFILP